MTDKGNNWVGKWKGGRTYRVGDRVCFLLEKMRKGRRYTLKLQVQTEAEALNELARFDLDPAGFRPTSVDLFAPEEAPEINRRVRATAEHLLRGSISDEVRELCEFVLTMTEDV